MIKLCLSILALLIVASVSIESELQDTIDLLMKKLNTNYWAKDQKLQAWRWKWEHSKGLYSSSVHFNTVDKINSLPIQLQRNLQKIDDINMFVSSFVLFGLLQTQQLGTIKVDHHQFSQTLLAISQFRDKNIGYGIPQYVFWPQVNINGTWSAKSVNLIHVIDTVPSPPHWMDNTLNKIGLGILTQFKNFEQYFVIPPDNDDSSVNLALLGMLKQTNSSHFQFWNSLNYRKQDYYNQVLKYAYRPFDKNYSRNSRADQIDPRTYFALWKFISDKQQQAKSKGLIPTLILPTTWLLNRDEEIKGQIVMPFDTNNVDASVVSNVLFALCYQAVTKQIQMNEQLWQMASDSADLLQFAIINLVQQRPDISLIYYPSKFDFYWFVSRTVSLLKRQQNLSEGFQQIYEKLEKIMKARGTSNILKNMKQKNGMVYWAQFLGNYGHKERNDDALFSTALAINALLNTWTKNIVGKIVYDKDLPSQVHSAISKGVNFLNFGVKSKLKEFNAFFSGSVKNFQTTFPYFYPANIHLDENGHNVDPQTTPFRSLGYKTQYYFKGTVSRQQYEKYLTQKWFGYDVPTKFKGFNDGIGLTFPYWTSKAITQIMMINSISKYMKAEQNKVGNLIREY